MKIEPLVKPIRVLPFIEPHFIDGQVNYNPSIFSVIKSGFILLTNMVATVPDSRIFQVANHIILGF